MVYTRLLLLLLLLDSPLYIRGEGSNGREVRTGEDKTKATDWAENFHSFQNISFMVFEMLARLDYSSKRCKPNEELKSMISELTEVVRVQGERMEAQEENIRYLRKSLDKRLRENDLKIEWALTDGTLAPKNTSGIMESIARLEDKMDATCDELRQNLTKLVKILEAPPQEVREPVVTMKVGSKVKVKASVDNPRHGWGSRVKPGSVGRVKSINPNGIDLYVDFPEHPGWMGTISEMEVVP